MRQASTLQVILAVHRGIAPVLLRLHELDQFEDATLVKAKVAALFTGFITDPDGTAGGLSGTNTNGALTVRPGASTEDHDD